MADETLIGLTATAAVEGLRAGAFTPHHLLDALETRIAAVDGALNALPTLCFDRARAAADALMRKPVGERGLLCGLPVPIKDLTDVAGVRTTYGSPIYANHVPVRSDILVDQLEASGAIIYAKSNTPEFGAGANTFNEVFGATRNPWNTAMSAAGSSGGAAAALASGMAWLAHGSDMGGSLRNPASFCGVVGLRPSIGRVAKTPASKLDGTLGVEGPMARNIEDVALLLDAMCGDNPRDPLSLPAPATPFTTAARSSAKLRKVAYSPDLGITPVDPEVIEVTRAAAMRLAAEGVVVEEAHPDLREAHDCFQVLRALSFAIGRAGLLRTQRALLKPEMAWNIEKGLALSIDTIAKAEAQRVRLATRMAAFLDEYDLLLCPATIVPPFPVEIRYPESCAGQAFETYIDWLAIVYAVTLTGATALSMPCGLTATGLPIGLQVIAPARKEARLLAGARFVEDVLGAEVLGRRVPIDPKASAS